jgi:hypothetical protein
MYEKKPESIRMMKNVNKQLILYTMQCGYLVFFLIVKIFYGETIILKEEI